jgi:hypothetical protein
MVDFIYFYIVMGALISLILFNFFSDISFRKSLLERKKEYEQDKKEDTYLLNKRFSDMESRIEDFRKKYIEHQKDYENVHTHLAKITDQQLILAKALRRIKNGMVQRHQVTLKPDFAEHLKSIAKKVNEFV